MAKNNLTPLQDVLTREFLIEVADAENVFSNNPARKRTLIGLMYELLNYQVLADGRCVSKDKKVTFQLGGPPSHEKYPNEWDEDYNLALSLLKGETRAKKKERPTADDNYTYEADSGEQTKNPSLWKALFSKDL